MEIQKSQCMEGAQGLPFQAPPRTDPGEPPAPTVGLQPGRAPSSNCQRKQGLRAGYCPRVGAFFKGMLVFQLEQPWEPGSQVPFVTMGYGPGQVS